MSISDKFYEEGLRVAMHKNIKKTGCLLKVGKDQLKVVLNIGEVNARVEKGGRVSRRTSRPNLGRRPVRKTRRTKRPTRRYR